MLGMVGGNHAVDNRLRSGEREITVQFHHGDPRFHRIGPVHLDFVIGLREQREKASAEK